MGPPADALHTSSSQVANSWNPHWGERGYFRIVRGTNEGGIEAQVVGSAADAEWGFKRDLEAVAVA